MKKYSEEKQTALMDTECFPNFWSIGFKCIDTGRFKSFHKINDSELNIAAIRKICSTWRLITFNGMGYDMIMLMLACRGWSNRELKDANDIIIPGHGRRTQPWEVVKHFDITYPEALDVIDLMPVSPGSPNFPSLKIYGGRLHSKKMQDLPFTIDHIVQPDEIDIIVEYNENDLDTTGDLARDLKQQIAVRAQMSDTYGIDLRSKSDAQVAEAVIKVEVERVLKRRVYRPDIEPKAIQYTPPAYVKFQTPMMREFLHRVRNARFTVGTDGKVYPPREFNDVKLTIGEMTYVSGIGGLHSTESSKSHLVDGTFLLRDRDVTSYYPAIILQTGLVPQQLGPAFVKVYRRIYERRIRLKAEAKVAAAAGNKELATRLKNEVETLKIVLNGAFGKLGSPFSILYSPNLMIQVTLTGQLSVLMLIESLEVAGFKVVSANTDGFVTNVPNDRVDDFNMMVLDWELDTGLNTEETVYWRLGSRDVNCYMAFTLNPDGTKGDVKRKGGYGERGPGLPGASGQKHNPDAEICSDAIEAYLNDDVPIEKTIQECDDIRKFVRVRKATQGAADEDGNYLGKNLRWYYSSDCDQVLLAADSGNTIAKSQGAKLCLELPDTLPGDIDYQWYVREAYAILEEMGADFQDPSLVGRTKQFMARLEDEKNLHIINPSTGRAICGKKRKSIRDSWIEYAELPEGHRLCAKCRREDAL